MSDVTTSKTKKPRGMAALSPEKRREIASRGGKAVHAKGTAHQFTPAEARVAGLKGMAALSPEKRREIASLGGKAAHAKGTAHQFTPAEARVAGTKGGLLLSQDREHMAKIGSKGGLARVANLALKKAAEGVQS